MRRVCARSFVFALATVLSLGIVGHASPRIGSPAQSTARFARFDNQLRRAIADRSQDRQRVIVRAKPGAHATLRDTLRAHGAAIVADHESLNGMTAVLGTDDLERLADDSNVLSVSADAVVRPTGLLDGLLRLVGGLVGGLVNVILPNGADTSGPPVPPAVLRATLGVSNTSLSGRGVGVAVIDSGLEYSSEFSGRVTAFYDFTTGGAVSTHPYDDYGHGTHVAGTIGGSGALSSSGDYRGLAPNVKFVVLKVLDKNGAGYTSDVVRAIDFAVANKAALGIDIINLSLGHPILEPAATDPLVLAVERASQSGIIVIAAAGNYGKNPDTGLQGYAGVTSPGNAPSAITVGASKTQDTIGRDDDRIADYSSAGPTWYDALVKPDVVSPGHNIIATAAKQGTLYKTYPQLKAADGDYMRLSGTSMATAVTSGAVALLIEANRTANHYPSHPSLTPNAVKAMLHYTALGIHDDNGIEYDALRKGAGALNAKGAIDLGKSVNTAAMTGSYWLTSEPSPWTVIDGQAMVWSQAILWGTTIMQGSPVSVNEAAWGTAILWGTNTPWASAILWGTNVVWSDPQSWANAILWGTDVIGQNDGEAILWGTTGGINASNVAWKDVGSATTQGMKGQ